MPEAGESIKPTVKENSILSDWDKPFDQIFPTLTLSLDLGFIQKIDVADDFFPKSKFRNIFEQRFIFYLAQSSLNKGASLDEQRTKAQEISELFKTHNLQLASKSNKPGNCLFKNFAQYSVYKDLNLTDKLPEEFQTEASNLITLLSDVDTRAYEVLKNQNFSDIDAKLSAKNIIRGLIKEGLAFTFNDILKIIEKGPVVKQLSKAWETSGKTEDRLTDNQIQDFIVSNYPVELNNGRIKIARVSGSDKFLFLDKESWTIEQLSVGTYREKIEELGIEEAYKKTLLSYVSDRDDWISIEIFNLCQNVPEIGEKMLKNLDYLDTKWPDEYKRKIYALGVLAHEFLHRLQTDEVMAEYKTIASQTWNNPQRVWNGYPSEYVMFYVTEYQSGEDLVLREDMADAVQIYVINSAYLKDNYPERFEFIRNNFPHLVPDSAQKYAA